MKSQTKLLRLLNKYHYYALNSFSSTKFNCKKVSQDICSLTREKVLQIKEKLKISVILAE